MVDSGNHYIIQVKENQRSLCKEFAYAATNVIPLDTHETEEKGHGRIEWRKVSLFEVLPNAVTLLWKNCNRYIVVERKRTIQDITSYETSYYLSDVERNSAAFFGGAVRGHWGIENRLHYVKDVVQNEDNNKVVSLNAPVCISVCGTIAINIHRKNNHQSISYGQIKFGADIPLIIKYIRT